MDYQIYLAGPWFTERQAKILSDVKNILNKNKIKYFSPKDECLFVPGETTAEEILKQNIIAMDQCDYVLAITDGKDPGTLWECGFAFAKWTPVIYVWIDHEEGQKFNLVLSASGIRVCMNYDDINSAMKELNKTGMISSKQFEGDME